MIEGIVKFCCKHAVFVTAFFVLIGLAGAAYTDAHFAMNSNSEELISPKVAWRRAEAAFDREFPQRNNLTLVVIDGATPEIARDASVALQAQLAKRNDVFLSARRSSGAAFFERNGLLFLSLAEVKSTTEQVISAQPFLAALAADPSLRGLMHALSDAVKGVEQHQANLEDLQQPLTEIASTLRGVLAGRPAYLSWQSMVTGRKPTIEDTRTFLEVQPKLDYEALAPGAKASRVIRDTATALNLTPSHGVRVRLTGPVPLADEEFMSLEQRAGLMTSAMLIAVLITLWLAAGSLRIIFAIALTLGLGLAITMAFGLLAVGVFNIISIAFIALFVGLGVDFGIQFSVRYRAERHQHDDIVQALSGAGRYVGLPLGLAAAATAVAFFSFLPTSYVGVAELGLIAGVGMLIAFMLSVTLLPALLKLLKPRAERAEVGFSFLAPLDSALAKHRRGVLFVLTAVGVGALVLVPFIRFDADPMDLRNPKSESVSTLADMSKDLQTTPNTVDVLAPSLADAEELADRLGALPEVGQVLDLKSFVPDDQAAKLALISDASMLLDPTLNPFVVAPPPSDSEIVASLQTTAQQLRKVAGAQTGLPASAARDLADLLDQLIKGDLALRQRANDALISGMKTMLDELRNAFQAAPVTIDTLPADLKRDWVAPDGVARVEVAPKKAQLSSKELIRFSKVVRQIAPNATGSPVSVPASGQTIVTAFTEAGGASLVAIFILLSFALRRIRDVLMTILPLIWAGAMSLATCVAIDLPLNFANIISLPLFMGIGVAFSIYYVVAWRAGETRFLQSPLTRAILFSGLTTGSAFGSLALSSHPGTASMGELLMISLGWTLIATLILLPPLLGAPPLRIIQRTLSA